VIKITDEHRAEIKEILKGYNPDKFDICFKKIASVLREYYSCDPAKITRRLLESLFSGWLAKPNEAIVHYWTICKLIHEYNYPADHLAHEVSCGNMGSKATGPGDSKADVVVYSDPTRFPGTALVVVECKAYGETIEIKQAASYARSLQAPYHLSTDSSIWSPFETQPHPIDGNQVGDIPHWIGSKPLVQRLSKSHILPPISDEKQLRSLIRSCHDEIHSEGVDPAKAFDELIKLLFVKVYDEQEIPDEYRFSVLSCEDVDETGENIRNLLREAKEKSRYNELFTEPGDDEFSIPSKSIRKVVETFQGFSFTGSSLIGIDAKGTAYENMVGATFRGEMGQYFTPRKIVQFMVDLLSPGRDDVVLDPSCGSGGFLIYAMRQISNRIRAEQSNLPQHQVEKLIHQTVVSNVKGVDLSPRMVRATRMNMIMHGDGWSGIQRCHGLKIGNHKSFKEQKFTLILSNPPFAGFESDNSILRDFEVGINKNGDVRGVNKAIIFVEQIVRLLADRGRAGIVLPRSIFENESEAFQKIRRIIFESCEILALVGLPKTAFHHTDCGILGDLLFIKKTKPRKDYDVFVGWAENVGYNTLGHNIEANDLDSILESYKNQDFDRNLIPASELQKNDNINPWFYHAKASTIRSQVETAKQRAVPLSDLVSIYPTRISRKALRDTPDRIFKYVEVRDVDPNTGTFVPSDRRADELPSRATYELNGEELILLPNAKNSIESGRKVVKIGGGGSGGIILTNRYLPLRPKYNADYLVLMLNSQFVRDQITAACRGAGSPDFREGKLDEIMIPIPVAGDMSSIENFMSSVSDKMALLKRLEEEVKGVSESIESLIDELSVGKSTDEQQAETRN